MRSLWVSLAVVAVALTACGSDQNRGLSANISNRTHAVVRVHYGTVTTDDKVIILNPGDGAPTSRLIPESPTCTGPWIAESVDGREIARAETLCPGGQWTIAASN